MDIRNIAIIAHVDHGKTTLVDGLLRQCNTFAAHEKIEDRVMDSGDLERERGITILSKNTSVTYQGVKINIVDTPGHADFGGEVERVVSMVDGALLLVDASEGPLPQTRFVLRKAMEAGLRVMVCINKIDRPDARISAVLQEIYDLFIDLDANDDQLEFKVLYACAREGYARRSLEDSDNDLRPLLDAMLEVLPKQPAPSAPRGRILVTNLDYDPYVGRIAIGRLLEGPIRRAEQVMWYGLEKTMAVRLTHLYTAVGLRRVDVEEATPGDIIAVSGIEDATVGDTIAAGESPVALPRLRIDEPTIGVTIGINDGPLSGREGKLLTGRQIRARIERELEHNVSLKMDEPKPADTHFKVYGRGELQLCILVEQMRREGFELTVGRPEVVRKTDENGEVVEPWERVTIDVPDEYVGSMTQAMAARKGQLEDIAAGGGRTRLRYLVPSRGLIGFRMEMLNDTRGMGIMVGEFAGWMPDAGSIPRRTRGSLVADRMGKSTAYALYNIQPRGDLFIGVGVDVYEGMIVGIHSRDSDLNVHAAREKQLTNFRSAGADEKLTLTPPKLLTLETALEFIDEDERVEITPKSIRLRKTVLAQNQRGVSRRTT
jgi:GTP-binding protein